MLVGSVRKPAKRSPGPANRTASSPCWCPRMFTAKEPRSCAAAHAREVTLGQNSNSGGAKDTEVSELTVIPTASPEGLRPVTTATGCCRSRKTCRRSATTEPRTVPELTLLPAAQAPAAPVGAVIAVGDAPGLTTVPNWDAQGMRATESHDTVLEDVFVPDSDVLCVVPAGPPSHPAVAVMQVWAVTLIAKVYIGIAERALEIAVAQAARRTSIAIPRGTFAHHPLAQQQVADMYLALDAARSSVDAVAQDWVRDVDHGPMWGPKVLAAKWQATVAANRVVDLACEVVGGSSYRRGTELERLSRDVRAARFHPGTDAFTHEIIGKALLGVDGDGPRW